jgi:hypothetical protein
MNRIPLRTFHWSALGICLFLAVAGCASAGGGGDDEAQNVYEEDLGRVVEGPLVEARQQIWRKHNINLYREERSARTLYFESEWMPREPTTEEMAAGVTEARNRVTMRGYQTGETLDGAYEYRMNFRVENQVKTGEYPDWHPAPMPQDVRNEFRRVYSDLQMELRAGVRR